MLLLYYWSFSWLWLLLLHFSVGSNFQFISGFSTGIWIGEGRSTNSRFPNCFWRIFEGTCQRMKRTIWMIIIALFVITKLMMNPLLQICQSVIICIIMLVFQNGFRFIPNVLCASRIIMENSKEWEIIKRKRSL